MYVLLYCKLKDPLQKLIVTATHTAQKQKQKQKQNAEKVERNKTRYNDVHIIII